MTTTPTPSQPPLSAGAVQELPVVAWRRFSHASGWHFWGNENELGSPLPEDLTPHAPAQATINAQAAEIERLRRERDELNDARNAAIERSNFMLAAARDAQDVAFLANDRWSAIQREIDNLKAKQVAEADEVMRLADEYASTEAQHFYATEELGYMDSLCARRLSERDATREALRAALSAPTQTPPCRGTACGTTTGEHSAECVAEHARAVAGLPRSDK